ncbi:MAG: FprA family A-type flavoprotein [Muribaculaceae bacterium]|nr:FprA family A-type flavoprotein [Muribaculaceae bacterium]
MDATIAQGIKYIGVNDYDLDLFESQYRVPKGISYNSYLIIDDKVALMDTVDARMTDVWRSNLVDALSGREVDYLVVHHLEPDHAANVRLVMEMFPQASIVTSPAAAKMLPLFNEGLSLEGRVIEVAEGDELSIGPHTLRFINAPMVHWPEVIMSFEVETRTLFSADGFGTFGTLDQQEDDWACEARRYYFNICGKYGAQVQAVLKKVVMLPGVERICPLHGPVLTGNLGYYLGLYDTWSRYAVETPGVLVAYASIHGNTAQAARYLAGKLRESGAERVVLTDLSRDDMAEAVEDAFRMDTLVVAASTYDADLFPPMHDFIHHLKLKGFRNRRVAIIENGSWAPVAARKMLAMFEGMKDIEIVSPAITIRGQFKTSDREALDALAGKLVREK